MHRRFTCALSTSLAVLAIAPAALAQRAPDPATIDRGDGITKVGLDLGFVSLDGEPYSSALRLELYGQYVSDMGLGVYGAMPLSLSFGDDDDPPGDQDDAAFGNLDLGLLYVLDGPSLSWVFRGGVALPSADDDLDGSLTNYAAVWPRFTDLALTQPDATYVRLAISPLVHARKLFLRVDLGVDIGLDDDDLAEDLLRLNVAGGVDLGIVALSLELATLAAFDDFAGDETYLHTLAVAARFMTRSFEPFLAVGAPLDDSVRDRVDLFLSGGIQVPFR